MRPEDQRGTVENPYTVIVRTLIFITHHDKLLLLRGSPTKRLWANQYNGIGGHLEPGESLHQSAARELKEETGLTVPNLAPRGVIHITLPEPPGILIFVFTAESEEEDVASSPEGTPVWVKRSDLPNLPLVEDLPVLLERALEPGPFFFAHYTVTPEGLKMSFET